VGLASLFYVFALIEDYTPRSSPPASLSQDSPFSSSVEQGQQGLHTKYNVNWQFQTRGLGRRAYMLNTTQRLHDRSPLDSHTRATPLNSANHGKARLTIPHSQFPPSRWHPTKIRPSVTPELQAKKKPQY